MCRYEPWTLRRTGLWWPDLASLPWRRERNDRTLRIDEVTAMNDHESHARAPARIRANASERATWATATAQVDADQTGALPLPTGRRVDPASGRDLPASIGADPAGPTSSGTDERSRRRTAADTSSSRLLFVSGSVILVAGFAAGKILGPLMVSALFWLFAGLTRLWERSEGSFRGQ